MSRWKQWIVDRFGLEPIRQNTMDRRVPRAPWYYGDGASLLLLLGVLVVTGMMMTLTYTPSPDGAYDSVRAITDVMVMGGFIRALHYWSAGMMVVMVIFHLIRTILIGGYKFPREGTFLIGVIMLFAVLFMSITGYVLRWDARALFALNVILAHFQHVPVIGDELVLLVQGGPELGAAALTRLYALHVIIVPMLLLGLTGYHVYLVILKGTTSKEERRRPVYSVEEQKRVYEAESESPETGETFFPFTAAKSARLVLVVFGIVLALAAFSGPQMLYSEANLIDAPAPAEEWWFWWYSSLIALTPAWLAPYVIVMLPIAAFLALTALPLLDRSPYRGIRRRPAVVVSLFLLVLVVLGLTNLRYFSPWTGWPRAEPPAVPEGVEITAGAEIGRHLFADFGCNTCHAVAGDGARVGPDFADLDDAADREDMRAYILNPPPGVAMPGYEGRLTDEQMDRLLDFVMEAQTFPRR